MQIGLEAYGNDDDKFFDDSSNCFKNFLLRTHVNALDGQVNNIHQEKITEAWKANFSSVDVDYNILASECECRVRKLMHFGRFLKI